MLSIVFVSRMKLTYRHCSLPEMVSLDHGHYSASLQTKSPFIGDHPRYMVNKGGTRQRGQQSKGADGWKAEDGSDFSDRSAGSGEERQGSRLATYGVSLVRSYSSSSMRLGFIRHSISPSLRDDGRQAIVNTRDPSARPL